MIEDSNMSSINVIHNQTKLLLKGKVIIMTTTANDKNARNNTVTNETKMAIAMQNAAMVEEASTCSCCFIRDMSVEVVLELEETFKEQNCISAMNELKRFDHEFTGKQKLLLLASILMRHIYCADFGVENMILSGSETALKKAYSMFRKQCARHIISHFKLFTLDRNIAYEINGDCITIQMLTGTVKIWSNGHTTYRHGYVLEKDGIALDPSKRYWDVIIFLMYTE